MMFSTTDASTIDKAQLRPSLRSRVSAFSAALKPKRHGQHASMIAPSAPQSECSTLVDFVVEDVLIKEDDIVEFETEDYMLDAENSAWGTGKYTASSLPKKSARARASQQQLVALPETQMLTGDNTAWTTTSSGVAQYESKSRTRFFATGGRRVQQGKSGVEPEYLDPEDRAWM